MSIKRHFLGACAGTKIKGVFEPGHRVETPRGFEPHTFDWRADPGTSRNSAGILPSTMVGDFDTMVRQPYDYDAYHCSYILYDLRTGLPWESPNGGFYQPRVNKDGVRWLKGQDFAVETTTFVADCDTIGHLLWNPTERADTERKIRECPHLQKAFVYFTPKGYRVVQRLMRSIDVEDVEPIHLEWLLQLEKFGIMADAKCRDWTHLMRTANHVKGGQRFKGAFWNYENECPIDIEEYLDALDPLPIIELPGKPKARRSERKRDTSTSTNKRSKRKSLGEIVFTSDIPVAWDDKCKQIGRAVMESPQSGVRDDYFGIFGLLLRQHTPPQYLPEIARRIAFYADSKDIEDKVTMAHSTIEKWKDGKAHRGLTSLKANNLKVAEVVFQLTYEGEDNRIVAQLSENKTETILIHSPLEANLIMENVYRYADRKVIILHVDAGLGKSYAAWRVAVERMASGMPARDATPMERLTHRWSPESKTIICQDKNSLVLQTLGDIQELGHAEAVRFFGIASLKDEAGRSVCAYPEQAEALTQGKQSVLFNLCLGGEKEGHPKNCPEVGTCAAYLGRTTPKPPGSPIGLCTPLLAKKAQEEIGKGASFFFDEPSAYLKTESVTADEIQFGLDNLPLFSRHYGRSMKPVLTAVLHWTRSIAVPVEGSETTDFVKIIEQAADVIDHDDIRIAMQECRVDDTNDIVKNAIECATAAFDSVDEDTGETIKAPSKAPPLLKRDMLKLRMVPGHAARVGKASRVLKLIWDAVTAPEATKAVAWVEEVGEDRVLSVMQPQDYLVDILRREEGCVVSDANAELHIEIIEKIIVYKPEVVRLYGGDAMPVERVLLKHGGANKTGWFSDRRLTLETGMVDAVKAAVDFANEKPLKHPEDSVLTLITFKQLRNVIEWALGQQDMNETEWSQRKADIELGWKLVHKTTAGLGEAAKLLRPILTQWRGKWILGHYHGIRGMNNAKNTDVIVTIGDPWTNRLTVAREASYLQLDPESRQEQYVRAELEQAQQRGRTSQRTKPLRALHIGMQVPSSHLWTSGTVTFRSPPEGAPRKERGVTPEALRFLLDSSGLKDVAVAKEAGLSRQRLYRLCLPVAHTDARPCTAATLELIEGAIARLTEQNSTEQTSS